MATDYTDVPEVKTWLKVNDSHSDVLLEAIIPAVSRQIDGITGDFFGQTASTQQRTYTPDSPYLVCVDPIATVTGLLVKTDWDADGTFETTVQTTDFEKLPVNASHQIEPEPWREIQAVGSQLFPLPLAGYWRRDLVQVTATFGWPAVPAAVALATKIQVGRVFSRRNSQDGIVGETAGGFVVRVPPPDRDVMNMLAPYVRGRVG